MSAAPRGSCPACGKDLALRAGEIVREHDDPRAYPKRVTCEGSGKPNGCSCPECSARKERS